MTLLADLPPSLQEAVFFEWFVQRDQRSSTCKKNAPGRPGASHLNDGSSIPGSTTWRGGGHLGAVVIHLGFRQLAVAVFVGRGKVLVQHFGGRQLVLGDAAILVLVHVFEAHATVDRLGGCHRGWRRLRCRRRDFRYRWRRFRCRCRGGRGLGRWRSGRGFLASDGQHGGRQGNNEYRERLLLHGSSLGMSLPTVG